MMRLLLGAALLLVLTSCGEEAVRPPQGDPGLSRFMPGQVWSYKTRPGEEASRLYVCEVEHYEKYGVIVHIYVEGLKIQNPHGTTAEERLIPVVGHMPFLERALDESVLTLEKEGVEIPPYHRGYARWRKDFLAGKVPGGANASPVAENLAAFAKGLQGGR